MTATLTILIYLACVLGISFFASRKIKHESEEFHLSGRSHGPIASALSSAASTESGFVLLGMVGAGYVFGFYALWILPAGILGYYLLWKILGPGLRQRSEKLRAITVPELITFSTGNGRVSRLAGILASIITVVFLIAYTSAQFHASAKVFASQYPVTMDGAFIASAAFVIAYAMIGGFRAVVWTDVLQASVMAVVMIFFPVYLIIVNGGPGPVIEHLRDIDPVLVSFFAGQEGWGRITIVLPWIMLGLAYPGQPHAIARLMAIKNVREMRPALVIATSWFVIIYAGAVILGIIARAEYAGLGLAADPEQTLPILATSLMPAVVSGIVVAATLAAITSTADSTLISASTTVIKDWAGALGFGDRKTTLFSARAALLVIGAIAVVVGINSEGLVFEIVLYAFSGLGASIGPTVLYCSKARDPKALAALSGLGTGFLLYMIFRDHSLNLLIGFSASFVAIWLVHQWVDRTEAGPKA